MNTTQRIKMGLLLARLKLGAIFTTDKSYPKDPNPENWRTINHAKVHLSNGKIDGGAGGKFQSNAWVGKEKHGNNSFFPLNQMYYGKKAQTNAKSAEVSSQAGAAGASQAKQAAKAASKSKAASAVAEGQTSAIAAMQEYMQQKKAAQQTPPEEAVPFGSPDLEPPKPDGKLPIYHINSLKGTFKNLDADIQDEVKQIIKYAKTNGDVPAWSADAFTDADYDLAMKTVEALKTKNITPTAAQNIMGALYANKKNYLTNLIHKNWPDTLPEKKTPTLTEQLKEIEQAMGSDFVKKHEAFQTKHKLKASQMQVLKIQASQGATEPQLKKILKKFKAENKAKGVAATSSPIKGIEKIEGADVTEKLKNIAKKPGMIKAAYIKLIQNANGIDYIQASALVDAAAVGATEAELKKQLVKYQKANAEANAANYTSGKLVSAFTPEKIKKLESLSPAEKIAEWDKYNQMPDKIWFNQGAQYKQQEDAQKFFSPIVSKWHKKMTEHEKNAVEYYTSSGYGPINRMLRGKDPVNTDLVETVERIDKALNKLPDNTKTMSLRRGVYADVLSLIKKAPNGIFVDQGYTSSSPCSKGGFGGTVDLEIIVPPGMGKMAWVDDISTHTGELELILPRGARYMVCDIDEGKSKPKVRLMLLGFDPNKLKKK